MPFGDASSIIRVSILGDAKKLIAAIGQADKATNGLLGSTARTVGTTLVALGAIREGFDFLGTSLNEADRLGDAMGRLTHQLSAGTAEALERTADGFTRIGASRQDILELEAIFADFATTAGIADPTIAGMAEQVAATATALVQFDDQGRDSSAMLDLITKAAGGSAKAARELGVTLIEGATAGDQMRNILAQLQPKLVETQTGTQDLSQKQAELNAKIENLSASLGEKLAPALADVLQFINDEIDAIPHAIAGFQMLGRVVENAGAQMLSPLARVNDALNAIEKTLRDIAGQTVGGLFGGGSESFIVSAGRASRERNGQGSP